MINNTCNILIVEDEWISGVYIQNLLIDLGQNVIDIVTCANDARLALDKNSVDFIFMDINIQGSVDGIQLAHSINEKQEIPIIYMTAFGDSATISEASQSNIYGFIIKPFSKSDVETTLNVAIARLQRESNRVTQHTVTSTSNILTLSHDYTYNFEKRTFRQKNEIVKFSKNEAKLIHLFCENYGNTVNMQSIYTSVWETKNITESTVRDTILRIRKKIPELTLENISGIGYALKRD